MKDKVTIRALLEKSVQDCMKLGEAYTNLASDGLSYEKNLRELYTWTAVDVLCVVLDIDSCVLWNRIVTKYPILGEVTKCSELS